MENAALKPLVAEIVLEQGARPGAVAATIAWTKGREIRTELRVKAKRIDENVDEPPDAHHDRKAHNAVCSKRAASLLLLRIRSACNEVLEDTPNERKERDREDKRNDNPVNEDEDVPDNGNNGHGLVRYDEERVQEEADEPPDCENDEESDDTGYRKRTSVLPCLLVRREEGTEHTDEEEQKRERIQERNDRSIKYRDDHAVYPSGEGHSACAVAWIAAEIAVAPRSMRPPMTVHTSAFRASRIFSSAP